MKWFNRKQKTSTPGVVYELKPGSHYIIEYSTHAVSRETIYKLDSALRSEGIKIYFVPNPTNHRAFEAVPATIKAENKST